MGHLAGYGDVWFDAATVANILSLRRVSRRFKVTLNSEGMEGFVVQLSGGRTRCFNQIER